MNQSNHSLICVKCQTAMTKKKVGAVAIDMAGDPQEPYRLINCDIYECPQCGVEITSSFAAKGVEKHESHFSAALKAVLTSGKLVVRNYEAGKAPKAPTEEHDEAWPYCNHQWGAWKAYSHRGGTVRGENRGCELCGAYEERNRVQLFGYNFWDVKELKLIFPTLSDLGQYEAEQRAYAETFGRNKETFVSCPGCSHKYFVESVTDFLCLDCAKWSCLFINDDSKIVALWSTGDPSYPDYKQPTNFGIIE